MTELQGAGLVAGLLMIALDLFSDRGEGGIALIGGLVVLHSLGACP